MSDFTPMDVDSAIFQMRTSSPDRILSNARPGMRRDSGPTADLENASEQFESMMLNFMIREMRATVPESALFPPSMTQEIFTGMLDEKIAGEMAQNGGIGISRMIFNQLKGEK